MLTKRPKYETDQDRAREASFAADIGMAWGVRMERMPDGHRFDYTAMNGYDARAYIEIKVSNHSGTDNSAYIVCLSKWLYGRLLTESTALPTILCVRFSDADLMYRAMGTGRGVGFGFLSTGRSGRADPDDRQACVRIPIGHFEPISKGL